MHIPDGFLDATTAAVTYALFLACAWAALRGVSGFLTPENVSLVTVVAAAIFAAQMLNWPIPGGTSLHLVGGALAGIMLGPRLGFLAMFLVLLVQCLVFHDGGITALGANVINMAVVAVLTGYGLYKLTLRLAGASRASRVAGAFLGGWLSVILAGLACGIEIGVSPSFGFNLDVTVPVMVGWHAALGVIEGLITALVVGYISGRHPNLLLSEVGTGAGA